MRNRAPSQATPYAVSALPSAAVQIAAGQYSSYVLVDDGSVWAWGKNNVGQLGDGCVLTGNGDSYDRTCHRLSPVRIEGYGVDTRMRLPPDSGVTSHVMFVVAADGVAMGSGPHSGDGQWNTDHRRTAGAIPKLGGGILNIARGNGFTLVLQNRASCGDVDGEGSGSTAVSDDMCGTGWNYDPNAVAFGCFGLSCDPSAVAVDRDTCCISTATCGDVNGHGFGTTAVSDEMCGNGWAYNAAAATSKCLSLPCDPSTVVHDQDTCCISTWTKVTGRYCSDWLVSGYSTQAEAHAACEANVACLSIHDSDCDGEGDWSTCGSATGNEGGPHCLYVKP